MEALVSPSWSSTLPNCSAPVDSWHARLCSPLAFLSAERKSQDRPHLFAPYRPIHDLDDDYNAQVETQRRSFLNSACKSKVTWSFLLLLGAIGLITVEINKRCQVSLWHSTSFTGSIPVKQPVSPRDLARNATLGFEKIYTLTQGTAWRLEGLHAAAEFTGLLIEEPRQAPISDELLRAFEGFGPDNSNRPGHGAARAWMAHLNLLELVMQSKVASALIVEDDVDWDVALLEQMPAISDGIRNITKSPADHPDPYGPNWDVIWLGHCGEVTEEGTVPYLSWPDDTVISHAQYSGFATQWIDGLPEGHRTVNPTFHTVCSFAYAVSYEGVPKVLTALNHGEDEAFDIALSRVCRDSTLRCYTIHPEIIHHYVPPAVDGFSSEVKAENGEAELGDASLGMHMGTTNNLVNSTRCHVLWHKPCVGHTWT